MIRYSQEADTAKLAEFLQSIDENQSAPFEDRTILVPVCYEQEFAPDLKAICNHAEITFAEFIDLHTSILFETWMIGFMPGFPYLGELPPLLQFPRKPVPNVLLAAGSVAIAEEYTGVYPFESPGGWHVIGRTPWKVVDYSRTNPWLFEYGTRVRFYAISASQFLDPPRYQET
jgi:inhibitor of KinA